MIEFTLEECKALYETIDNLSGGNAENAFRWDGSDSKDTPHSTAHAKLFKACGQDIPKELE